MTIRRASKKLFRGHVSYQGGGWSTPPQTKKNRIINIQHALKNTFLLKQFFCIVTCSIGSNIVFFKNKGEQVVFLSTKWAEGGGIRA